MLNVDPIPEHQSLQNLQDPGNISTQTGSCSMLNFWGVYRGFKWFSKRRGSLQQKQTTLYIIISMVYVAVQASGI